MARTDVYQSVTDQVVALLAEGTVPWHQPWKAAAGTGGFPRSAASGKRYRGINVLLLGMAAQARGFSSPYWATFNQAKKAGGNVIKGQKSTKIVLWKPFERVDKETGEKRRGMFATEFSVFNLDQIENAEWPARLGVATDGAEEERAEFEVLAECEQTMKDYYAREDAPTLAYGGNDAYYQPGDDHVQMPPRDSFESPEQFYGTWFHETVHSTGHADRLARPDLLTSHRFGDRSYSAEELTAELGAAFLAGITGIDAATVGQSAAYLAGWMRKLRDDPKALMTAAGRAQRAVDLILGDSPAADTEE